MPIEILHVYPVDFSKILFELFAPSARLQVVMKDWDCSILIYVDNKKGLIAMPANHRPLRPILILRKLFEMRTTERLVRETPDELEEYGFNEKSMALTPVELVVSAASPRYVINATICNQYPVGLYQSLRFGPEGPGNGNS